MFEAQLDLKITSGKVSFVGQMDTLGLQKVRDELKKIIDSSAEKNIVFNFSKLEFINSESIGFLVELQTHAQKSGKKILLENMNEHVQDILSTVGLIPLFS